MTLLSDAEITERLAASDGWAREGGSITREWTFPDFAEAADHHPDILLHGWNKVRLTLSTHSQGGLTGADFALAGQINRAA